MKNHTTEIVTQHADIAGNESAAVSSPASTKRRSKPAKRAKNQLLVVALSIVVVGLLAASAFAEFSDTAADAKAGPLGDELSSLIGKTSTNFAGNFANLTTAAIIGNSYLKHKTHLTVSGTTIVVTPGNGSLVVSPGTIVTANDSGQWALTGIDDTTCDDTVNSLAAVAAVLTVNGTQVKANGGTFNGAAVQCDQGTNSITALAN